MPPKAARSPGAGAAAGAGGSAWWVVNVVTILDSTDIERLMERFSLSELRQQAHASDVEAGICRQWGDDNAADFHEDIARGMRAAADLLLYLLPSPKPTPGHPFIDVESVKARHDMVSVAERYTRLRKSGNSYVGRCPLHEEKTPSFFVFPKRQRWHCFGACGRGGDVISLVMEVEHIDFRTAAGVLDG